MANPRQRNKAKSSRTQKPSLNAKRRMHQKLRKAPPLKGPEVLQERWDKKKTVFQKYVFSVLVKAPSITLLIAFIRTVTPLSAFSHLSPSLRALPLLDLSVLSSPKYQKRLKSGMSRLGLVKLLGMKKGM